MSAASFGFGNLRLVRVMAASVAGILAASCQAGRLVVIAASPAVPAVQPQPGEQRLHAGAARVDITPPPGYGMMGWGPDGHEARGHRQRLHARALVLRDANGELFAFVSVELGMAPVYLHRLVAERVRATTKLGVDRLLIAATHTHSGPGSYFANPAYDELGSSVAGHDSSLVAFLVDRISVSVERAHAAMQPARAAWSSGALWDVTRVRSFGAYAENPPEVRARMQFPWAVPLQRRQDFAAVDPTVWMLRVDTGTVASASAPLAAFTIFAMHGTVFSAGNDLYDSDVHGYVSAAMERRVAAMNQSTGGGGFFHLFVNGAEGDASPAYDGLTRCAPVSVHRVRGWGPNARTGDVAWTLSPLNSERNAQCVGRSVAEVRRIGEAVVERLSELHGDAESNLSANLLMARAFTTVHVSYEDDERLCRPRGAVAQVAGVEDGWGRVIHWPLMSLDRRPTDSLVTAARGPTGCQRQKRLFLNPFQDAVAGSRPLPNSIQLSLIRVGAQWLATVPGEPTINSGWIIRRSIADSIGDRGAAASRIAVVGLANGYNSYVTTESEYAMQAYEGGSTIFGPATLAVIAEGLGALGGALVRNGGVSVPISAVPPVEGRIRESKRILKVRPCSTPLPARAHFAPEWRGDTLYFGWSHADPGLVYNCTFGPWFRIVDGARVLAADGELDVEVRVRKKGNTWLYEGRWAAPARVAAARVEFLP